MNTTEPSAARSLRRAVLRLFCAAAVLASAVAQGAGAESATHTLAKSKRTYVALLPAGPPKGQALVVFLHGTGKPNLDRFKADWRPLFWQRGCVVAVPKPSGKLTWQYADAKYIMDVIADVQKRYQIDEKRVILMGVSGGGQTALFLVDHAPESFRAVIAVSTNPVVIRRRTYEWFYPDLKTVKACPYFVVNHITQGAAIQYWRQVRVRREPAGASLAILPVLGPVSHYLPPPKAFAGWLDAVLAGKHPAPLADPQTAAVAKMLAKCTAALPKAVADAKPATGAQAFAKDGEVFRLTLQAPANFERSKKEDKADAADKPLTQVRVEDKKWPVYVRCDARRTQRLMADVLKAEQQQTIERGMLYQVYHTGKLDAGKRAWQLKIGSITYPHRKRGWVTNLFLHAAAAIAANPKEWLEVTVMDETQKPDAAELAGVLRTVLENISASPAPATKPAGK